MKEDVMTTGTMRFRVRLLKEKRATRKVFSKNSVHMVTSTKNGKIHIMGWPSVILADHEWEPLFDREDLVRPKG